MFENNYSTNSMFPYAKDYFCGILPTGLPEKYYSKSHEHIFFKDYVICFKPNTPKDIMNRVSHDYAEFYNKNFQSGEFIN